MSYKQKSADGGKHGNAKRVPNAPHFGRQTSLGRIPSKKGYSTTKTRLGYLISDDQEVVSSAIPLKYVDVGVIFPEFES
jgi:hypothetical protein